MLCVDVFALDTLSAFCEYSISTLFCLSLTFKNATHICEKIYLRIYDMFVAHCFLSQALQIFHFSENSFLPSTSRVPLARSRGIRLTKMQKAEEGKQFLRRKQFEIYELLCFRLLSPCMFHFVNFPSVFCLRNKKNIEIDISVSRTVF